MVSATIQQPPNGGVTIASTNTCVSGKNGRSGSLQLKNHAVRKLGEEKRLLGLQMKLLENELRARQNSQKNEKGNDPPSAGEQEAYQKRLLQLEINLLEHQIAMKVIDGKLAEAIEADVKNNNNHHPKKTKINKKMGQAKQPYVSTKRPLSSSCGPVAKQQQAQQRHLTHQQHSLSQPSAVEVTAQPSIQNKDRHHVTTQHTPIRGKPRHVRDGSRLASILNRLEQSIQRNEQRGENNADRFIQNMVNNPQVRGRALVAANQNQPRSMIHTGHLPRYLLQQQPQQQQKWRRRQHQPYRDIAPSTADELRHGKYKANLGTLCTKTNEMTTSRNEGERASFSNNGVRQCSDKGGNVTNLTVTACDEQQHVPSTITTIDISNAKKNTPLKQLPRAGSLKNHLNRVGSDQDEHNHNQKRITIADTSVGTTTTTRTTGSKSTVIPKSSIRDPAPFQQLDASCSSHEYSASQPKETMNEPDEGSYSLYEEYTESEDAEEETEGFTFENSYAEETVYSHSISQQQSRNTEDSFMEETVRSDVPSKSNLFESWASYEEEEIVYEEEREGQSDDDDQTYEEETIVSYSYSLVNRSRKQHAPSNNGDSIASLQSELDDLRNELNGMEDYEDISLQEDEDGNLVIPMSKALQGMGHSHSALDLDYEEEVLDSIREEDDDEPIKLFVKTPEKLTSNGNRNIINLKSNIRLLMEDGVPAAAAAAAAESGFNENDVSVETYDASNGKAKGNDESRFRLRTSDKVVASSLGSLDPLQSFARQSKEQVKENLPSVLDIKPTASSVVTESAQIANNAYDENEGYYGDDGEWRWYADEGFYDDDGNWNWYENEGYYDNDGYWHWWENEGYYDDDGKWYWFTNEKEYPAIGTDEQASGEVTAEKEVQLPQEVSQPENATEKASPVRREPDRQVSTSNPASQEPRKKKASLRVEKLGSRPMLAGEKSSKKQIPAPPPESSSSKPRPTIKTLAPLSSTQEDNDVVKKEPKTKPITTISENKSFRRIRGLASRVRGAFGRKRRRAAAETSDPVEKTEKEALETTNGHGAKPHYYRQKEKDKIRLARATKTKLPVHPHPDVETLTRIEFVYDWIMDRYVPRSIPISTEEQDKNDVQLPEKSEDEEVCIQFIYDENETDEIDYGYDVDEQDGSLGSAFGSPADGPTFCPMANEDEEDALAMLVKKGRVSAPKREQSQHSQQSVSDNSTASEEEEEYWGSQIGFNFDPKELEDDDDVIPLLKNGGTLGARGNNAIAPRNASTSTRRGGRRKSLDDGAIDSGLSDSVRDSKLLKHNSMHNKSKFSLKIDEEDEEEDENDEEEAKRREIFREAHKMKGFAEVVQEAASLGRLTRLNEKVIEASGTKAAPKKSRRASVVATNLLDIQWKTTHHGSVCNDIVELGQMYRGKEVITESQHHKKDRSTRSFESGWSSNDYTSDSDDWDEFAGESDDEGVVESRHRRKDRPSHIDGIVQRVKEQHRANNTKIVEHLQNQNPDEIELPHTAPPRAPSIIRRQQNNPRALRRCSIGTIKRTLTEDVIQRHSERQARVETGQVHMKGQCDCPYCYTASPYQTYAYKKATEKQIGQPATWVRQNGVWSKSIQ